MAEALLLFSDPLVLDDGYHVGDDNLWHLNDMLSKHHYLGPVKWGFVVVVQWRDGLPVSGQAWRKPTSRHLPADGTWLELVRWVLTPHSLPNDGSRMHKFVVRYLKQNVPKVTTLVSYSDPSAGHTGSLYRACNWKAAPTWLSLRPPPSGQGSWKSGIQQSVKDRWIFPLRKDSRRGAILSVKDGALNPTEAQWVG